MVVDEQVEGADLRPAGAGVAAGLRQALPRPAGGVQEGQHLLCRGDGLAVEELCSDLEAGLVGGGDDVLLQVDLVEPDELVDVLGDEEDPAVLGEEEEEAVHVLQVQQPVKGEEVWPGGSSAACSGGW